MKLVTFESPWLRPALDGEEPCADVPPLVHEALFEDAAPDVLPADDADEATDGAGGAIDEPEAAEDETVTEAGCAEPEPRPEAETAAPEGRAPAEFPANAEQSAKVADAEAIGAFVDNASHLREELADLAQLLHPRCTPPTPRAAPAFRLQTPPRNPPCPEPLPSPLPHPRRNRYRPGSPACRCASGCRPHAWPAPRGGRRQRAPTQAAAVIRQPEDEAHVDTDTALDIGNDTEHLLQDVQGTLADLAGMAQQLSQQKQEALKQQESLESLQTQLHEKERQLQEKEKQLRQWHKRLQDDRQALGGKPSRATVSWPSAARPATTRGKRRSPRAQRARRAEVLQIEQERLEELRSQQNLRQAELEKREASVQQRSLELGERFKKLESARESWRRSSGFQRDRTVQYRSARHQSYRVETPGRAQPNWNKVLLRQKGAAPILARAALFASRARPLALGTRCRRPVHRCAEQLCAGQRRQAHPFGKLQVVADHHRDSPEAGGDHRRWPGTRPWEGRSVGKRRREGNQSGQIIS